MANVFDVAEFFIQGTPWNDAMTAGHSVLSQSDIQRYFIEHPVPHLKDKIHAPQVTVLPADWYDPNEDAEWAAYL